MRFKIEIEIQNWNECALARTAIIFNLHKRSKLYLKSRDGRFNLESIIGIQNWEISTINQSIDKLILSSPK